jgi:hypothetical protein
MASDRSLWGAKRRDFVQKALRFKNPKDFEVEAAKSSVWQLNTNVMIRKNKHRPTAQHVPHLTHPRETVKTATGHFLV